MSAIAGFVVAAAAAAVGAIGLQGGGQLFDEALHCGASCIHGRRRRTQLDHVRGEREQLELDCKMQGRGALCVAHLEVGHRFLLVSE